MSSEFKLRVVTELEGSPYPKASLFLRGGARLIDLTIAYLLYVSTGPAGIVIALMYVLFADGMLQGQSLGKKAFGVKVVYLPTRQGARHRDSVLRNAPLGLVIILSMMPDLGLRAFVGGCLVVGGIEAFKCWKDPLGLRLGDLWANTQVTDGKVVAGAPGVVPQDRLARATGRAMLETPEPPER
jgi:uncharacterized RDD family membrane protein YckC